MVNGFLKYFASLLLLFSVVQFAFSQERQPLRGEVTSEDIKLENVHVKNITSRKYTVTNAEGIFYLSSKAGDTLVLSHVGMEDLIKFVSKRDMGSELFFLQMTPASSELDEVLIRDEHEINAVSLGIIPKKIEKIPQQQRKLKAAGEFKPTFGMLTSIPLEPILNAITGRTKRLKKNVEVEHKLSNKAFLQDNYTKFMQEELELSEMEIVHFINYLIEDTSVQAVIESKNEDQMYFFLHDHWIKYQNILSKND